MTHELHRRGSATVEYQPGDRIERLLSPRPYLTADTPSGVPVTEVGPDDHPHHLGVSVALPDVNGTSFWGGRTFVRDQGSTMLMNHGTQVVREHEVTDGRLTQRLVWLDASGDVLLDEQRTVTVVETADAWEIVWRTRLTATHGDVSFGSPQTNGRDGAFYGGIFWRSPFMTARVRSANGEGAAAAHGSTSPWLALDAPEASLIAATTTGMPWFVRNEGYVGFGPAIAVTERRTLAAGESLLLDLAVAVCDDSADAPDEIASRMLIGAGSAT